MSIKLKSKILATSMLVMPAALAIGTAQPAHATCSVTSGGGTAASPADGAVVTCTTTGGNHVATVGNSTEGVAASVVFQDNAFLRTTGPGVEGIDIDNVVVTLSGANSRIQTANTGNPNNAGVRAFSTVAGTDTSATVTLSGDASSISTAGKYSQGVYNRATTGDATTIVTLSGDNTFINGGNNGLLTSVTTGNASTTVILSGDNSSITASRGSFGLYNGVSVSASATGTANANITLSGNNSSILSSATGVGVLGGDAWLNLTVGQSASITGITGVNVNINGAGNTGSVIDNSGTISGLTNAIVLDTADDHLILRTGSNLAGNANLGGGNDTVTLYGTGGENNVFLNAETLNMNGSLWSLSGISTFTDINVNSGLFANNSANLTATDVNINAGTNLTNFGTLNVTNAVEVSAATLTGTGTLNGDVNINNGGIWNGTGTVNGDVNINNGGTWNGADNLNGNLNVNSGGLWAGTGSVTGAVVNDGTVGPGNSIGTQTINGSFVQNAGGVLDIEFTPASIDLLDITGPAVLGGTVQFTEFATGVTDGTTLTFIQTTGGIGGAFSTVLDDALFVDPTVNIVGNDAQVTFNRVATQSVTQTGSAGDVAAALDSVLFSNPSSITQLDTFVNSLSSAQAADDFFASQSNLIGDAAITSGFSSMEQGAGIALGRLSSGPGSASSIVLASSGGEDAQEALGMTGMAAGDLYKDDEGAFWSEVFGVFGSVDGDSNGRGMDYDGHGFTLGREFYHDSSTWGIYGSYSETEADVDGLQDKAETTTYQLGLYGGFRNGPWHYQGTVSGAWMEFDTFRVTPGGTAKADFSGAGGFAKGQVSYDIPYEDWVISPNVGVESALVYHEAYREKGPSLVNLSVKSETTHQFKSLVGVDASTEFMIDAPLFPAGLILQPSFGIAWAHEFLDTSSTTSANFASASSVSFQTSGPERNRDSARLRMELLATRPEKEDVSLYIAYEGNLASDHKDHKATLGLKYRW